MTWLKLTDIEGNVLQVNMDNVIAFGRYFDDECTTLVTLGRAQENRPHTIQVRETPKQIAARLQSSSLAERFGERGGEAV